MNTIKITCPECKHQMEYWTRNNFINCTKCKASIPVEPCVEEVKVNDFPIKEREIDEVYLLENHIIFADEIEVGENDYEYQYFEDEELTKRIDDIDQFIEDYKNKIEVIEVKV